MKKSMSKPEPNITHVMQKYNVALVLDDSLDTPDGVQQYVLALGRWLSSEGHNVHYLVGHTTRSDVGNIHSLARNVKVRFNQNRMSIPLPASKKAIRQLLTKEQFDIIHVQMPYSPMLGARVIAHAPASSTVIGTFHVAPHSRMVHEANKLLRMAVSRSLKRFDEVISVSDQAALLAKHTFRLKSIVIPNGIDLRPFYSAAAFSEYAKSLNVVFLGRLVERKGCAYLLRAVAYIERQKRMGDANWQVIICGAGPQADSLQQYVASHGLQHRVRLTGFISEADKPRYLASADVVAYPSTGGESFGIVLIEAMAAARGAVLAGNNPGYQAVLANHPEALFDPKDTESFAAVIVKNLKDAEGRKAARAWQQIEARQYDVSVVGRRILAVYGSALRKRQR
jgi:phosphatidylinositol alpha-mannosyltransferase